MVYGFVKSPFCPIFVIPAEAGIQYYQVITSSLDSRFRGSDDFLRGHHGSRKKHDRKF